MVSILIQQLPFDHFLIPPPPKKKGVQSPKTFIWFNFHVFLQTEGCTVVESTKMELNRHHAKVHLVGARDKTYKCHICEYEFPTKSRYLS